MVVNGIVGYVVLQLLMVQHLGEIIKWARQNGCEWNSNVCYYAKINKHLEVLEWIKLNGCMCGGEYHK